MKKNLLTIIFSVLFSVGMYAQYPYYNSTPYFTEGFDAASLPSGWTQEGTMYNSSGSSVANSIWRTTNTYSPANLNYQTAVNGSAGRNADMTSTHSLQFPIAANTGIVSKLTSSALANNKNNVVVSFSFNLATGWTDLLGDGSLGYLAVNFSTNGTEWETGWRSDKLSGGDDLYDSQTLKELMNFQWNVAHVFLPSKYNGQPVYIQFEINSPNYSKRTSAAARCMIDGLSFCERKSNDAALIGVNNYRAINSGVNIYNFLSVIPSNSPAVKAMVKNLGTNDITTMNIGYTYGSNPEVVETINFSPALKMGEKYEYTFATPITFDYLSNQKLIVTTKLSGDELTGNNENSYTIINTLVSTPYTVTWKDPSGNGTPDDWSDIYSYSPAVNTTYSSYLSVDAYTQAKSGKGYSAGPSNVDAAKDAKINPAVAYLFSRPVHVKAGHSYELQYSANSDYTADPDLPVSMKVYTTNKKDTLAPITNMFLEDTFVDKTNCIGKKHRFTATQDTTCYFVFRIYRQPEPGKRYFYLYDVLVKEVFGNDAEFTTLLSPASTAYEYTSEEIVKVKVSNLGSSGIASGAITLNYQVDNGTVVSENFAEELAVFEAKEYAFNQKADLSGTGSKTLKTWLSYPEDSYTNNDVLTTTLNPKVTGVPYVLNLGTPTAPSIETSFWDTNTAWSLTTIGAVPFFLKTAASVGVPIYSRPIRLQAGESYKLYFIPGNASSNKTLTANAALYSKNGSSYTKVKDLYTGTEVSVTGNYLPECMAKFEVDTNGDYYIGFNINAKNGANNAIARLSSAKILTSFNNDISVEPDLKLQATQMAGTNYQLQVGATISNRGVNNVSSFKICYQVGEGTPVRETISTLGSGKQLLYYFDQLPSFEGGKDETIKVWSELTGDEDLLNDSTTASIKNIPVAPIPYSISSWNNQNGDDWQLIDANKDGNRWEKYNIIGVNRINGYRYSPTDSDADDYVMTPQIYMVEGHTYQIESKLIADESIPTSITILAGTSNQPENFDTVMEYKSLTTIGGEGTSATLTFYTAKVTGNHAIAYHVKGKVNPITVALVKVREINEIPDIELSLVSPTTDGVFTTSDAVKFKIKNRGSVDVNGVPFSFFLNNKQIENTTVFDLSLPISAGKEVIVTFNNTGIDKLGKYDIFAYISDNKNAANDTVRATINSLPFVNMAITEVVSPASGEPGIKNVTIKVKNMGKGDVSNVPVYYSINSYRIDEIITQTIAEGAEIEYTFAQKAMVTSTANYDFITEVLLANDIDLTNNSITRKLTISNQPFDVEMVEIKKPETGLLNTPQQVVVSVKNLMDLELTEVPVVIECNNEKYSEFVHSIPAGATVDYTFNKTLNLGAYGDHELTAYTAMNNDINAANDTIRKTVRSQTLDVSVAIVSPLTKADITGDATSIVIELTNAGEVAITTQVPVSYVFGTSNAIAGNIAFTAQSPLLPGAKTQFTFTKKVDLSAKEVFNIKAYSRLAADADLSNDTAKVTIDNTTSGLKYASAGTVVYPNPTSDVLNVVLPELIKDIRIYDVTGKEVYVITNVASNNYIIPVSSYNKGIYFVEIVNNEGLVERVKFIVE